MAVLRVVPNIAVATIDAAHAFYGGILGMSVAMDHGWIVTFAGSGTAPPQIGVAVEGGSGTPVPDISIEVDDLDEVLNRIDAAGLSLAYGPALEPWGVRRIFVRDPFGRLVNILCHIA
jgi:catechol 2,3-dioxygenase-like lactoylglutathione lyase family enzyme